MGPPHVKRRPPKIQQWVLFCERCRSCVQGRGSLDGEWTCIWVYLGSGEGGE